MARPTKREWTSTKNGTVVCFKSENYDCFVIDRNSRGRRDAFLTPRELTSFHDEALAGCTREINRILDEVVAKGHHNGHEDHKELCILLTDRGPLLAWVQHAIDKDDPDSVAQTLKVECE
ncbi:hypothetical protein ACWDZ6_05515 [Streptomyces sp. NPDC002926]